MDENVLIIIGKRLENSASMQYDVFTERTEYRQCSLKQFQELYTAYDKPVYYGSLDSEYAITIRTKIKDPLPDQLMPIETKDIAYPDD